MSEMEQAAKILIAFLIALVIIFVTGRLVGENRKERWFKQNRQRTFFTRRGMLGETWHFGVPQTLAGAAIMLLMYSVIGGVGYWLWVCT